MEGAAPREKRPKRRRIKGVTAFTSYFKEKRRKEKEKKEHSLQEAAETLKELLKPREFSEAEQERLRQLKDYKRWKKMQEQRKERYSLPQAKSRAISYVDDVREVRIGPFTTVANDSATPPGDTFNYALHHHTWGQRIAVITTLVILLFISFHSDLLAEKWLPSWLFEERNQKSWWLIVLRDWGRFWQMSLCALIHFALCDISLIYAFESLELGRKTGPKVKKFYRVHVHFAVAAVSGGIVAFSILWTLLMAWIRLIWSIVEAITEVVHSIFDAMGWLYYAPSSAVGFVKSVFVRLSNTSLSDVVSSVSYFLQKLWGFTRPAVKNCYHAKPSELVSYVYDMFHNGWLFFTSTIISLYTTPPSHMLVYLFHRVRKLLTGICLYFLAVVTPSGKTMAQNATDHSYTAYYKDAVPYATHVSGQMFGFNSTGNMIVNLTMNTTMTNATSNATIIDTWRQNVTDPEMLKPALMHWSEEAFQTCRFLLSHSAILFLVFLAFLNALVKSYRHEDGMVSTKEKGHTHRLVVGPDSTGEDGSTVNTTPSMLQEGLDMATELKSLPRNTHSTARPTTITVSISSSSGLSSTH